MQIINVDLVPGKVMPILHASQFDVGRSLGVKLYNGGAVYNLTGAEVVSISVRKPDGNIVTETLTNAGGSLVEIITTEQMTACAGASLCEIKIEDAGDVIGSANFVLEVEEDPLDGGIESESEIDNLATQIADINNDIVPPLVAAEVANQYDSGNVIFDNEPTTGHGTGYAVTSDGLKSYVPKVVGDLSDVNINNPQLGEALVFDALGNVINGTVSTVGSIDDLNDVDTTGKANADSLRYNATAQEWEAKPTTVEMDLAEYTALGGDYSGYENTNIIITDAPNLNATAQDISYDGSTDTVWDKVESLDTSLSNKADKALTGFNLTAGTGMTLQYVNCFAFGNLKVISANILVGSGATITIATVPSAYSASNTTFFYLGRNGGNGAYGYMSGTTLKTDSALPTGNYTINFVYR